MTESKARPMRPDDWIPVPIEPGRYSNARSLTGFQRADGQGGNTLHPVDGDEGFEEELLRTQKGFGMDVLATIARMLGWLVLLAAAVVGGLAVRFYLGRRRADQEWADAHYPKLTDIGKVRRLSILPLIDKHTAHDGLVGEAGVSYLVQADDTTILFDVGLNQRGEHPSPLLRNMQTLGVTKEDVDCVVISHLHLDHVGDMASQRKRTFALSGEPSGLGGMTAFAPETMTHPTAQVEVVEGPQVIAPGVATLGPIPRQLFFFGWTPEQSLAVNVEGKGIILISGCGHSTVRRIVDRAGMLFDERIYGVVGGLHYPVTGSGVQRVFGTGKWPWTPINREDVKVNITHLQRHDPQLVALSPHDSCDWSIDAFRQVFGEAYQDVVVGEEIVVE